MQIQCKVIKCKEGGDFVDCFFFYLTNKLVKLVYHLFYSNVIKHILLINTLLHKSFYFISTRSISVAQCSVQSNVYILEA